MQLIAYLHAALTTRLADLRREPERGDSPVPTAVIIFGLVAAALFVTGLVMARARNWMNAVPTAP
ncbi:DUF2970 domain-containing protein [Micromonospora sp. DR5-3]|uniref:DUF2970 domain-containing protein n=1 Tax=unclassified Micromonospora TaxID=2617518 RepID=UPI0011D70674|nr:MULTISPECIES: DUF2970 domain-containing protein [unclassified Micromonospora]MCW3813590.1 DUF2970 domain-containing protein [Micromonospora sp. DR5-3]TYC25709.1 DUF2970 domain-containing protein [Micromonospora sp. MP36]